MGEEKKGPISQLIRELTRLPGIGEKTASRLAFHLIGRPETEVRALASSLIRIKKEVRLCSSCCNLTEVDPCRLCSNPSREKGVLCVVESPQDLHAIERTMSFRGLYHVLHGTLSPLDNIGPEDLRIKELIQRLRQGEITEVILATNPTVEGDTTALYLTDQIKVFKIKVSRIAQGIPIGGELEYTDKATLGKAFQGRYEL